MQGLTLLVPVQGFGLRSGMRAAHSTRNRNEPLVSSGVEKRKKRLAIIISPSQGYIPCLGITCPHTLAVSEWRQGENEMYRKCGIHPLELNETRSRPGRLTGLTEANSNTKQKMGKRGQIVFPGAWDNTSMGSTGQSTGAHNNLVDSISGSINSIYSRHSRPYKGIYF
jgi:hypothetical protein